MVEIQNSPYDHDGIPLVQASLVSIDAELSGPEGQPLTAHAIGSTPIDNSDSASSPSILRMEPSFTTTPPTSPIAPPRETNSRADHLSQHLDGMEQIREDISSNQESAPTEEEEKERERTLAAGAAGAVLGLLLGGPFLAMVFGFGTAYYSKEEGPYGDVARALGEVAIVARDKAKEVEHKHHLVDKGKVAATEAIEKIQEADRRHQLKDRFSEFISWCWASTLDYAKRHHLIEKASEAMREILDKITEKMLEHQERAERAVNRSSSATDSDNQQEETLGQ